MIYDIHVYILQSKHFFFQFRLFKLAKLWPAMNKLLLIIRNALGALSQLLLILMLIIYIFAVFGLQLFRNKYKPENFPDEDEIPR